jgi:serine/threonine protein kinase
LISFACSPFVSRVIIHHTTCHFISSHFKTQSDNILFGGRDEVRLADFGFATKLTEEVQARQSLVGTTHWMAPEVGGVLKLLFLKSFSL